MRSLFASTKFAAIAALLLGTTAACFAGPQGKAYPIGDELAQALQKDHVVMLALVNQEGEVRIVDTKGRAVKECGRECDALKNVSVEKIDAPVVLRTKRNPTCVVWYSNGRAYQSCW